MNASQITAVTLAGSLIGYLIYLLSYKGPKDRKAWLTKYSKLEEDLKAFFDKLDTVKTKEDLGFLTKGELNDLNVRANDFNNNLWINCLWFKALGKANGMLAVFNQYKKIEDNKLFFKHLNEEFNPDSQDCQTPRQDLQLAITLNPSLDKIENAVNNYLTDIKNEA